jgi:hypothetical protein
MDRRRFLRVAAAGAAAGLTSTGCAPGAAYDDGALARPDVLAALGPSHVRAIGEAYREQVPAERDAESLREAIAASTPWSSRLPWSAPPPLAARVRSDFEDGRTVVVGGWVLSLTEARQCALYSLLPA